MFWVQRSAFFRNAVSSRPLLQGNSKGFGFVSYDSFEASDAAIEAMNGQYLCNRPISVMYAYKKARGRILCSSVHCAPPACALSLIFSFFERFARR